MEYPPTNKVNLFVFRLEFVLSSYGHFVLKHFHCIHTEIIRMNRVFDRSSRSGFQDAATIEHRKSSAMPRINVFMHQGSRTTLLFTSETSIRTPVSWKYLTKTTKCFCHLMNRELNGRKLKFGQSQNQEWQSGMMWRCVGWCKQNL